MLLLNYILEIKNRIILLVFTWSTVFLICYHYKEIMLYVIIKPSFNCIVSFYNLNKIYFITTHVTEIFDTYINLANICSNKICLFFLQIHLIVFIRKGLYNNEINLIKKFFIIYTILYFFSIILLYYIIIPICWNFFFNFQEIVNNNNNNFLNVYFESKLSEYLTFYKNIYKISNLLCQIFTCIFIYFNQIKNYLKLIKKTKKFFFFFLFIITTLIAPPDVLNQILFGSLIIITYEIFILITLYFNYINKVNH